MEVDVSNRPSSVPLNYRIPTWLTLRILISSTFKDMMSERDILIRYVFPELKRRAASVFAKTVEVDLRWGITEADSASKKKMASGSLSSGNQMNINELPLEALAHIFGFLPQNKLGQIARVCKRWNTTTKYPKLWKNVQVQFHPSHLSQERVTTQLVTWLPHSNVYEMSLYFIDSNSWSDPVDFDNLGPTLARKCPDLKLMLMQNSVFSNSIGAVLNRCCTYLPQITSLVFRNSRFTIDEEELRENANIELLEISSVNIGSPIRPLNLNRMPLLKELYLYGSFDCLSWLSDETELVQWGKVIGQLTTLHVGFLANESIFRIIKRNCHNLRELYLCATSVKDQDLIFDPATFPHLKTICLRGSSVSTEGIHLLGQSCPSLRTIYVEDDLVESVMVEMAPFVKTGACSLHLKYAYLDF